MGQTLRIKAYQAAIVVLALALSAFLLHWIVVQPALVSPGKQDLTWCVAILFTQSMPWAGYATFQLIMLGLMAIIALAACALAAFLAWRVPDQIAARRLAWALIGGAFAAAYLYFVTTHAQYRSAIGWSPGSPIRVLYDFIAYSAGMLAPIMLARFFLSYPRAILPEEWETEHLRWLRAARASIESPTNWRRWLYPAALRARMARSDGNSKWFHLTNDAAMAKKSTRMVHIAQSGKTVWVLVAWALVCALLDWYGAREALLAPGSKPGALGVAKLFVPMMWIVMPLLTWEVSNKALRIYSFGSTPDDRRKVDWIRSTLFAGGMLVACIHFGGMASIVLLGNWLSDRDIFIPAEVMMLGPAFAAVLLLALAFIVALAMSIFYRGAIDPRLAARKLTFIGVLSLVVAVLFVLIERTIAFKIIAFFNLSPDAGALVAGAAVAATLAPVRNHAEKGINAFVGRFLPLDSMVEGERSTLVVALSDLSGYTLLSSRDEKQAMLLAALLQRQAANLTHAHGGRVVKSMGDAVMFAFDDISTAVKVLTLLHSGYAPAAGLLGLEALPVHTGVHYGEVTVATDGDLYGQTVNLAARIQGSALPGQIVVSGAFAAAAGSDVQFKLLGTRSFKNVPDPVECRELTVVLPAASQAAA